jgi:hypothetical protein
MNEVDLAVRQQMLTYPTLFSDRFTTLESMLTTSNFCWKDGKLVSSYETNREEGTPESMIAHFQRELSISLHRLEEERAECLKDLYVQRAVEVKGEFLRAEHLANNIDVYATFSVYDHRIYYTHLFRWHRHGINSYGAINNKPEFVDPVWGEAIREWLREIMPTMNSMMGWYDQKDPTRRWKAGHGYETVFNWVMDTHKLYTTPEMADREAAQSVVAKEIIDEIIANRDDIKEAM